MKDCVNDRKHLPLGVRSESTGMYGSSNDNWHVQKGLLSYYEATERGVQLDYGAHVRAAIYPLERAQYIAPLLLCISQARAKYVIPA